MSMVIRRNLPEGLLALEDGLVALLALLGTVANVISLSSLVDPVRVVSEW
jgi:hypothetical protein